MGGATGGSLGVDKCIAIHRQLRVPPGGAPVAGHPSAHSVLRGSDSGRDDASADMKRLAVRAPGHGGERHHAEYSNSASGVHPCGANGDALDFMRLCERKPDRVACNHATAPDPTLRGGRLKGDL